MQWAQELHVLSHLLVQSNVLDNSHGLGIDGGLMRPRTPTMELHLLKFPPSQVDLFKWLLVIDMLAHEPTKEQSSVGVSIIWEMARI